MRTLARQQQTDLASYSAGAADHQRDLAAELSLGRHAVQFCFFQRPVFNAEGLGAWKGHIIMELRELLGLLNSLRLRQRIRRRPIFQSVGSSHYVNGVDEELSCDPRFFLV